MNPEASPASVPGPLAEALQQPFVPGHKDECEFIDHLNDWQGEP